MGELTLAILLVWHFIADYGLQTQYIAENKGRDRLVLHAHCMIHAGAALFYGWPVLGLAIYLSHMVIDGWIKAQDKNVDQSLHMVSILGLWLWASNFPTTSS